MPRLSATERHGEAAIDFQSVLTDDVHLACLQPTLEPELREAIAACKAGADAPKK